MMALAAGVGAALAGGPEQANAQASEVMLPHPDGEIVVDVARVALDTQMQILDQLRGCLQTGFTFADADTNGRIEGDEQFDWDDERGFCAVRAQSDFQQAGLREQIEIAEARQAAANARISEAAAATVHELEASHALATLLRRDRSRCTRLS